jgi:cardiolipin synthase
VTSLPSPPSASALPPASPASGALGGPPENPWFTVGSDEVRLLRDGHEAFPAMLAAIAAAEHEILLEFYWVAPDRIGRRFRDALVESAARGVRVRVIYDSLGSRGMTDDWWRPLRLEGGDVREYHALLPFHDTFRFDRLIQRDHRKLLVVDGEAGFIGGINIGNDWLPATEGGAGWRDDAIAVRGEVSRDIRALFYRTWHRVTHEPLPADVAPFTRQRGRAVYVLASQRRRRRSIYREYRARIDGARRSIDLAHAYFVPDRAIRQSLFRAAARGVRVRVLLPEVNDVPGVQLAVEALFDRYLEHGIEIFALPPPMLHAKTAIIDRRFVTIGSYNLDERLRKNLEANVAVVDERFAAHVTAWFESDLARAKPIDQIAWRERSVFRRAAERIVLALRGIW